MVAIRRPREAADQAAPGQQQETAGRSLRQIVWARLRRDRVAMVALGVLIFMYSVAIFGPFIAGMVGISPYTFDPDAISGAAGGAPVLPWGGISLEHPLGVEWGTGDASTADNTLLMEDG